MRTLPAATNDTPSVDPHHGSSSERSLRWRSSRLLKGSAPETEAMSRTDKDVPWWIESEWYRPSHGRNCRYLVPYSCPWGPRKATGACELPCDLPDEPRRGAYSPRLRYQLQDRPTRCIWEPCYERFAHRYRYTRPPLKRERHLEWYGPDRAKVRDLLLEARRQYQGSGNIDVPEPTRNHRHASVNGRWN